MRRFFFTLLLYILPLLSAFSQKPDFNKMSPFVRKVASRQYDKEWRAKGNKTEKHKEKALVAFVRTNDVNALTSSDCVILASFDDIHIVKIPLRNLNALSILPEIKRIEAGRLSHLALDTTRIISNAREVNSESLDGNILTFSGYTGKNVIVGVEDICFDLTHPTFWSVDGQRYRIKALWDQMAKRDGNDGTLAVGRQFVDEESLLDYKRTADYRFDFHGTHTSAIAAGSGWNGSYSSSYVGIAPDADICLVCNFCGENHEVIDEEDQDLYTDAMDILGFKYIFDYAESQGKPCVINFSEGRYEDFYGETMYYETIEKLLGPGRILCASAGNDGSNNTYLKKSSYDQSVSTFIKAWGGRNTIFMCSDDEFVFTLDFFTSSGQKEQRTYSFDEVLKAQDQMRLDTITVNNSKYALTLCIYPSGLNPQEWGIEFYLDRVGGGRLGYDVPIMLTLEGKNVDIEAHSVVGELFANKTLCPQSVAAVPGHNIIFPASTKNVICVGSTSYPRTLNDFRGNPIEFGFLTNDKRSGFSSMGPTIQGFTKPDVVAPGENVISAMSSYYLESRPEEAAVSPDIERFQHDGRTYAWTVASGTSMSAPVVTGVIALWLEACPTLTPTQILDVIAKTSRREEGVDYPNNRMGWGEINAKAGLSYVLSEYTGITDVAFDNAIKHEKQRSYYDINGRKLQSVEGKRGLFLAVDEYGSVKKIIR